MLLHTVVRSQTVFVLLQIFWDHQAFCCCFLFFIASPTTAILTAVLLVNLANALCSIKAFSFMLEWSQPLPGWYCMNRPCLWHFGLVRFRCCFFTVYLGCCSLDLSEHWLERHSEEISMKTRSRNAHLTVLSYCHILMLLHCLSVW